MNFQTFCCFQLSIIYDEAFVSWTIFSVSTFGRRCQKQSYCLQIRLTVAARSAAARVLIDGLIVRENCYMRSYLLAYKMSLVEVLQKTLPRIEDEIQIVSISKELCSIET